MSVKAVEGGVTATGKRYIWQPCPGCGGHGVVSAYTFDGSDFLSADECDECHGLCSIVIYESNRLARYPGGPLIGSWPGRFQEVLS